MIRDSFQTVLSQVRVIASAIGLWTCLTSGVAAPGKPVRPPKSQTVTVVHFDGRSTHTKKVPAADTLGWHLRSAGIDAYWLWDVDVKPALTEHYASGYREFLVRNIYYPLDAMVNGITGTVYGWFDVDTTGTVTQAETYCYYPSLAKSIMTTIQKFPKFTSGREKGKTVTVRCPVKTTFNMNNMGIITQKTLETLQKKYQRRQIMSKIGETWQKEYKKQLAILDRNL